MAQERKANSKAVVSNKGKYGVNVGKKQLAVAETTSYLSRVLPNEQDQKLLIGLTHQGLFDAARELLVSFNVPKSQQTVAFAHANLEQLNIKMASGDIAPATTCTITVKNDTNTTGTGVTFLLAQATVTAGQWKVPPPTSGSSLAPGNTMTWSTESTTFMGDTSGTVVFQVGNVAAFELIWTDPFNKGNTFTSQDLKGDATVAFSGDLDPIIQNNAQLYANIQRYTSN